MSGMRKGSEWQTPHRARPEPRTAAEIRAEIEFLEDKLNGGLDGAIEHRIAELRRRLGEFTESGNN